MAFNIPVTSRMVLTLAGARSALDRVQDAADWRPVVRAVAWWPRARAAETKKADVVEYPEEFHHVGLLVTEPPGTAGLPFS
jgi:hypothetical protein